MSPDQLKEASLFIDKIKMSKDPVHLVILSRDTQKWDKTISDLRARGVIPSQAEIRQMEAELIRRKQNCVPIGNALGFKMGNCAQ